MEIAGININDNDLIFVPLGGSNEIGMNMNLYHFAGKWIIVDLGISFGDDTMPGVDVLVPDPSFIESQRENLLGIVATHGHEDHIGAIPHLWERLRCPVFATPFTASLIRKKLIEKGIIEKVKLVEIHSSSKFEVGPFKLELISLTHSIPEPNGLVVECGEQIIWHTGDWKLDPDPQVGQPGDMEALKRLASRGVTAMVSDSTNAHMLGTTGSEGDLLNSLETLFSEYPKKIGVACFASNVARLRTIAVAAKKNDRHVALVGRSLWRMYEVAKENGYLLDIPDFISEKDVGFLPDDKVVVVCTGSQGEPRAALSRIADDSHPEISLADGDVVIFSSRQIPGNEKAISRLQNKLLNRGVKIITDQDHYVHVSGHPAHDEVVFMYQTIKPDIAIPVHGEKKHLRANALIAESCQIPQILIPDNGNVIRLCSGKAEVIADVKTDALVVDGKQLTPLTSQTIKDRNKLLHNGSIFASIVLASDGLCDGPPVVTCIGVGAGIQVVLDQQLEALICDGIETLSPAERVIDETVIKACTKVIKRFCRGQLGKSPTISIHIIRTDFEV
tara:strand:- start:854 stop:2533 length:1680 start_codon:yes stop_codon:yes gene_type:complete